MSTSRNTAYPVYLANTDSAVTSGISINSGPGDASGRKSYVTFTTPGVYNIAFSAQMHRTQGGSNSLVSFWLRRDGVNIPATNTDITLMSNTNHSVAAWNFFVPINCDGACDQIQLMWSYTDSHSNIWFEPAQTNPTRPATPSIIMTVNQVR